MTKQDKGRVSSFQGQGLKPACWALQTAAGD
jgi:hypothetical protein